MLFWVVVTGCEPSGTAIADTATDLSEPTADSAPMSTDAIESLPQPFFTMTYSRRHWAGPGSAPDEELLDQYVEAHTWGEIDCASQPTSPEFSYRRVRDGVIALLSFRMDASNFNGPGEYSHTATCELTRPSGHKQAYLTHESSGLAFMEVQLGGSDWNFSTKHLDCHWSEFARLDSEMSCSVTLDQVSSASVRGSYSCTAWEHLTSAGQKWELVAEGTFGYAPKACE